MKSIQRNVLLFMGIGIVGLATALYPIAGSVAEILWLRAAFGIGFGMASTVLPTLVSEIIPTRRMGEGIGYYGLSNNVATSTGPIIGLAVLDGYGILPFSLLSVFSAVIMILLLFMTHSIPARQVRHVQQVLRISSASDYKSGKGKSKYKLLLPASLVVLQSVTLGGLVSFLALYGKEVGVPNVGLFFLLQAIAMMLIRPISGRISDQKGHAIVIIPGILVVMSSLIVLSYSNGPFLLMTSGLLYGLGGGALQPAIHAWMLRETVPERYGAVNSLFYNSIDFGVAIGAMLLGVIASIEGYSMMYRYSAYLLVLSLSLYTGWKYAVARGRSEG